jgi:isoquinoline 1-oxidoreductase beta subunit
MLNRRAFLTSAAASAGALLIPVLLPAAAYATPEGATGSPPLHPNSFLRLTADGQLTVVVGQAEMGQGIFTALAAVLADELDADWALVSVESSRPEEQFGNPFFNGLQITAASTSLIVFFEPYRKAGAQARAMLLQAAAGRLGVAASSLHTRTGKVVAADGRQVAYGELVSAAAKLPVPKNAPLKARADFKLIGTSPLRADVLPKSNGTYRYGLDRLEGTPLVAVIAHPPAFGAVLKRVDDSAARAVAGFHSSVRIPSGIAVLAQNTWSALSARAALVLEWDESPGAALSTEGIISQYQSLATKPGAVMKKSTGPDLFTAPASEVLSAEYVAPYLAHLPMEPLNCLIERRGDRVLLEVGTQFQSQDQQVVAEILGIKKDQVDLTVVGMGGGFGRRANPKSDWIADAAQILKASPELTVPVKMLWTREDELAAGYYRPLVLSRVAAKRGASGQISAWQQRIVGQSACDESALSFLVQNGVDLTSVDGVSTMKYGIPDFGVEVHQTKLAVPVQWMRSVGHSHNVFFFESFMDELAHASKTDPAAYRQQHVTDPRLRAVLERVTAEAGWSTPAAPGVARGISIHEYYGTYVAMIAEVRQDAAGLQVDRITCAVDCGLVVNPDSAKGQVESAIVFGLSSALYGEITIEKGRPQQTNLHQYPLLRMDRCPAIEAHFIASDLPPGGLGESCVPSVAPALCNALFALSGTRIRQLPLSRAGLKV